MLQQMKVGQQAWVMHAAQEVVLGHLSRLRVNVFLMVGIVSLLLECISASTWVSLISVLQAQLNTSA